MYYEKKIMYFIYIISEHVLYIHIILSIFYLIDIYIYMINIYIPLIYKEHYILIYTYHDVKNILFNK